jgi:hypothetical protein
MKADSRQKAIGNRKKAGGKEERTWESGVIGICWCGNGEWI